MIRKWRNSIRRKIASLWRGPAYLRAIFRHSLDAIVICDGDQRVRHWNRAAENMFGWTESEVLGRELIPLLAAPDDVHLNDTLDVGAPFELNARTQDGAPIAVKIAVSPRTRSAGSVFYVAFIEDVTRVRRGEMELLESREKAIDAAKFESELVAAISHEIRTPLNGIMGMTSLLERTELDDKQKDYLHTIKLSSKSLMGLVNQILDNSKIKAGHLALERVSFELDGVLRNSISLVSFQAQKKNLNLVIDVGLDVARTFYGDPLRLQQVLLNLLTNAVKFSDAGRIHLNVQRNPDGAIRFEVRDQGPGLSVDVQKKLFQPYAQADASTSRRHGGTGLGLTISRQLVELMGGSIGVDSQPGAGACFYFELPLEVSLQSGVENVVTVRPSPGPQTSGRVLVADDVKTNLKIAIEMLNLLGCEAETCENGAQVLDRLRAEKFDLVLMDVQMPEMDGFEATWRVRAGESGEQNVRVPIIAVTANNSGGEFEKALNSGMNDIIPKPVDFGEFARKVCKWLARGPHILNPETVESLKILARKKKYDLMGQLIDLFCQETPGMIQTLRTAVQQDDFVAAAKAAHALKSSSGTLGAHRLREICEFIEHPIGKPTRESLSIMADTLEREFQLAVRELQKHKVA